MVIARKQTLVQLTDELVEALDRRAQSDGKSRSAVIREAVEHHVKADVEEEKIRRYVEGYRRIPQTDEEMEWSDAALSETLRYLEEQEGDDGW
jgi:metal-responsive CopG/Arc/MetJ family transcriptional regulator